MNSLTITIPLPARAVSQNSRAHFRVKANATKLQRGIARIQCKKALKGESPPKWKKASIAIHAFFRTKTHPDPANFIGSLKASFDGIEDSGVIENDKNLWPERPTFGTDKDCPHVTLIITEEVEP
ncbi:hypothetical protein UFOVP1329_37 [uncultured Caudovirales phage]|uniref:Uncharacterized protein n=1 Tax=uncultured Caudovirales phage TaxID=2100421 RepID=A0A6J5SU45_9CAUD|nr:hypothetical protein UFOVP1150_18 [uncultured Caudovirales phage]CAB4199319.1 hypothetical protein UFOVP1329_37 [uncultured Caudovirales phage]CAB4218859.1 hypothetical protein UFOVP1595_43 [uncultured Caudovirales phage]